MRYFRLISTLLTAALLGTACESSRLEEPQKRSAATGNIQLTFATKAGDPTLADAADGGAFHNLLVVLTTAGSVSEREIIDTRYVSSSNLLSETGKSYVTEYTVHFYDLPLGDYHIGAYANIDHEAWQHIGDGLIGYEDGSLHHWDWGDERENPGALITFLTDMKGDNYHVGQRLKSLTPPATPEDPSLQEPKLPMLLTGHDDLSVGVVDFNGEVQLLRPVSRLRVEVNNYSGKAITLKDLHFGNFNPSTAFVMKYWGDDGTPNMPADVTYGALPDVNNISVPADSKNYQVYSTLLYEGAAPASNYRMYATVAADGLSDMSLGDFRIIPLSELTAMAENDTKTVLLVNPSNNGGRVFGHDGSALQKLVLKSKTEEEMMRAIAGLLAGSSANYYKLTLTKLAGGKFKLQGTGDKYVVSNAEGFDIVAGVADASRVIALEESDVVVRLKKGSNYYYNNNGSISTASNKENTHTRQWLFIDPTQRSGSLLKRVDPETSKVTPLVYMQRNQELTVVLNVYFQEEGTSFNFEVVDDNWGTNGSTSAHIFQ